MPARVPLIALALITCLAAAHAGAAAPPAPDTGAELAHIEQLAEQSPHLALQRLQALQAGLGAGVPYETQQKLLRTEVWLHEDAGELEQSYAAERRIYDLAVAHQDRAGAARASLWEVRRLLDQNLPDAAQAALDKLTRSLPPELPANVRVAFARTRGDVFNARAEYAKALDAYLGAMSLLEETANAGEQRASLSASIAQVYINNDHPEKAFDSAQRALALPGVGMRVRSSLQFTRGIALLRLGKEQEALEAFQQALASAQKAGLTGLEAAIRGNISDFFLRQRDYRRAEVEARKSLEVSEKVQDQNMLLMAKANLGFALMGQGQMAAGLPYVDGVIQRMRETGATGDLEAMLDEKGRMLEKAGKFADALAVVREQQGLQQRNARSERDKAIAALQEQFDATQRTRQIALLQRENQVKDAELGSRRAVQLASTFAAALTVVAGAIVFAMYRRAARSNAKLKLLNTQLEYHSTRDALTGLHNRRSFQAKMQGLQAGGKANRRSPGPAGVSCFLLFDIDHFKSINDRWGHGVGDAVLVEVAHRLHATVRDSDMVLRWGGEEFLIYAPDTDRAQMTTLASRVLQAVGSTPVPTESGPIPVTISAGVVGLPLGSDACNDWEVALRLADWALYQCKANGRNQAQVITAIDGNSESVLAILEGRTAGEIGPGTLTRTQVPGPAGA